MGTRFRGGMAGALLALLSVLGADPVFSDPIDEQIALENLTQISRARVSRGVYNYEFTLTIRNLGAGVDNVAGQILGAGNATLVGGGSLSFGRVAGGALATSAETFTLRINRRLSFELADLQIAFMGDPPGGGDVTPPQIEILAPPDLSVFGPIESVPVQVRATDNVAVAAVTVNGEAPTLVTADVYQFDVPVSPGANPILAVASDAAGNNADATITVFVDNVRPQVEILSPDPALQLPGPTFSALLRATDDRAGVQTVVLRVNDTDVVAVPRGDDLFAVDDLPIPIELVSLSLTGSATDRVGNVGFSETLIVPVADRAPPQVEIIAPPDGAEFDAESNPISVTVRAMDNVAVDGVTLNGNLPTSVNDNQFLFAGVLLETGSNVLTARAEDPTGNSATDSITVTLVDDEDPEPPRVTIAVPVDGAFLNSGVVLVSGEATDNVGVEGVTINNGGTTPADLSGNIFSATISLDEGPHTITATARDAAGNSASASVDVVVDLTSPVVEIIEPTDGATVEELSLLVRVSASDTNLAGVTVNGVPAAPVGPGFVATVPLVEGTNTIRATATDEAGNSGTDSISVNVELPDLQAPRLLINAPIDGSEVLTSMPTIVATYSDPGGINVDSFTLMLDGLSPPFNCSTLDATQAACTFVDPLAGGPHTVAVSIADVDGNVASATSSFNIDVDVPLVTIQFPSAGQVLDRLDVQVRVSATDFDGIAAVTVNGMPADRADPESTLYLADVTLETGSNTLTAVATDTLGNRGQAQVTFVVDFDMTPPTITPVTPPDGGTVQSSPTAVTVRVVDDVAVDAVTIGGVAATRSGDQYTASVALQEGSNGLVVIARDASGNQSSRTLSINLTIPDTTAPTVAIVAPLAGPQVASMVDVAIDVTDNRDVGNAMVRVAVNGRGFPATFAGGNRFTARIPIRVGPTTLTATATDLAGNQGSSAPLAISLEDLAPPEISFVAPVNDLLLTTNTPQLRVAYSDASGINQASLAFSVDGVPVARTCSRQTDVTATCTLNSALQEGPGVISAEIQDNAGRTSSAAVNVVVDSVPIALSIITPAANLITQASSVLVSGSVAAGAESVTVNGVVATVIGETFIASGVPLRGGKNMLVAVGRKPSGRTGSDSVDVTRDNIAPIVQITTPKSGAVVVNPTVAVVGQVNDIVSGATDPIVRVNGVQATVNGGSYMLVGLPLVPGPNAINVEARDVAGNVGTRSIQVRRAEVAGARVTDGGGNGQAALVRTQLPQPIMARVVDEFGNPVAGRVVTFDVQRNNGSLRPVGGGTPMRSLRVVTDGAGKASALWTLGDTSGEGNNQVLATALGVAGDVDFCATALPTPADKILMTMGDNQRGLVGTPLATPLEAMVIDVNGNPLRGIDVTFAVQRGGGTIDGLMSQVKTTGSDGIARAVLTLGPNPGINNNIVVATYEGLASRPATFNSSGLAASDPAQTRFSGVVVDNSFKAIPGAVVKINADGPMAVTDAKGQFTISGVPVGFVDLFIDPTGSPRPETFPKLHFETNTVAGQNNTLGMPISLPILKSEGGALVGGDQDVVITMPGVPGLSLKVFANSVTCADGSSECVVSINQVHLDKVPMPPPSGTLFMPPAWTVQPAGTLFDPPAQISIPNDGMPPGRQIQIYQFDHDLNQFIDIGKGTTTEDGLLIVSDPGFGITAAGWGGCGQPQPPTTCTISCDDQNNCTSDSVLDPPCACQHDPANEGGMCGGMGGGANSCVDEGVCMNGACVGETRPDGEECDDEVFCTMPDMCSGGVCSGTPVEDREFPTAKVEINLDGILNAVESFASIMGVPLNLSFTVESSASLKKICCEQKEMKDVSVKKAQNTFKAKLETDPIPVPALSFNIRVVKIGVAVQVGLEANANINGENNLCTDNLCWGGGVGVSAGAKGGLLVEAGEVVNIFGSLGSALKFEGSVSCEKISYGVSHDGLKGEITAEFLDGFIVIGLEKQLIPGGPIATGMIPLPSL